MVMRGVILTIAAVLALALPQAVHAQSRGSALNRTTLVVGDIDKSVDFYQRLGLSKISDIAGTDAQDGGIYGAADLPLTADPKQSRVVTLKGSDERGGVLILLWYDHPPLPSARGNLVGIGTGDVIVGIEVPDIQASFGRLSQIGTRFQRQPVRFSDAATSTSGQHMLAFDPDGHMVEVIQADRAAARP
jgi:catechol 2,3-dioxygenase-like lactoylglutathione lyase family enzyme